MGGWRQIFAGVFCAALLQVGGAAEAASCKDGRCVLSKGETNAVITAPEGFSSVRVDLGDWRCYGSNAPTQETRAVIRLFKEAAKGFIKVSANGAPPVFVWNGPKIAALPSAIVDANNYMTLPVRVDSPDSFTAAAKTIEAVKTIEAAFENERTNGRPLQRVSEVVVATPLGDTRTRVFDGCYAPADLMKLIDARREAVRDFLLRAGSPPVVTTETPQ